MLPQTVYVWRSWVSPISERVTWSAVAARSKFSGSRHVLKNTLLPCRLTAFLRFKPPSVKALTGRTSAAKAVHAVAPNGQPRKIPTAILAAGEQGLRAFAADEDQPNSAKGEQWTITSSRVIEDAQDCTSFSPLRLGMPDAS